jgi:hypothetical protein
VSDQPKKKPISAKNRNDGRRNGKASKTRPDSKFLGRAEYRGSKTTGVRLSELQKALLGGGAMVRITKKIPGSHPDR